MNHKRFQHQAYVLCYMFKTWKLYDDDYLFMYYQKSGILEINILTQKCTCNGQEIETLTVAKAMKKWLEIDLEHHQIPIDSIDKLYLKVEFRFAEHTPRDLIDTVRTFDEMDCIIESGDDFFHEHHRHNETIHLRKIVKITDENTK